MMEDVVDTIVKSLWVSFAVSIIIANGIEFARYEKMVDLLGLALGIGFLCVFILKELKDGE